MGDDLKIGLALSGGGTRAMAFHLGCFRAFHDLGILKRVEVMSAVSGGSLVAALFADSSSFSEFEERLRKHLSRGFVWPATKKLFATLEGLRVLLCWTLIAPINLLLALLSGSVWVFSRFVKPERRARWSGAKLYSPVRRFASLTTVFQRVFEEDVFHGLRLRDVTDPKPLLIITTAELRTGSAFYFSPKSSGSWRLGEVADKNVTVGCAVAASAAHPTVLPALDLVFPFNTKHGTRREERVSLTDGGVYDNLGVASLWPDRDPTISLNVTDIDTIICCRAGYGPRFSPPRQFLLGRLKGAFYCTHDRLQNAGIKRLFDLRESRKLKAVLVPYLGQIDSRLKFPPSDLVNREETFNYPTDFFGMSEEWINKLCQRGEQLTRALVAEHMPNFHKEAEGEAAGSSE